MTSLALTPIRLATLKDIRTDIAGMLETAIRIRREYLEGEAPFQMYVTHRSMVHDFLSSFAELVDDRAERSQNRLDGWADQPAAERERGALEVFARLPSPDKRRWSDDDLGA